MSNYHHKVASWVRQTATWCTLVLKSQMDMRMGGNIRWIPCLQSFLSSISKSSLVVSTWESPMIGKWTIHMPTFYVLSLYMHTRSCGPRNFYIIIRCIHIIESIIGLGMALRAGSHGSQATLWVDFFDVVKDWHIFNKNWCYVGCTWVPRLFVFCKRGCVLFAKWLQYQKNWKG